MNIHNGMQSIISLYYVIYYTGVQLA